MEFRRLTDDLSISPQIAVKDLAAIRAAGYRAIICNRHDGEGSDQPTFVEIATAAREQGIAACYLPVESSKVSDEDYTKFGELMRKLEKPVLAYCRTGMRAATLWGLSEASSRPLPEILGAAQVVGYELDAITRRIANGGKLPVQVATASHEIVIVGARDGGDLAAKGSLDQGRRGRV